jgi:hypothetical protein
MRPSAGVTLFSSLSPSHQNKSKYCSRSLICNCCVCTTLLLLTIVIVICYYSLVIFVPASLNLNLLDLSDTVQVSSSAQQIKDTTLELHERKREINKLRTEQASLEHDLIIQLGNADLLRKENEQLNKFFTSAPTPLATQIHYRHPPKWNSTQPIVTKFPLSSHKPLNPPNHPLNRILVVVLCNAGWFIHGETWVHLYRDYLPNMIVYGPPPTGANDPANWEAAKRINARVIHPEDVAGWDNVLNDWTRGFYLHSIMTEAIMEFPGFDGYMLSHNDAFVAPWHFGWSFDFSLSARLRIMLSHCCCCAERNWEREIFDINKIPDAERGEYPWHWVQNYGKEAIFRLLDDPAFDMFKEMMRQRCETPLHWFGSNSDWLYVSDRDAENFVIFQKLAVKHLVSDELSIPTFFECVADDVQVIHIPQPGIIELWDPSLQVIHPVKFTPDNVRWAKEILSQTLFWDIPPTKDGNI